MKNFRTISSIDVKSEATWRDSIFLTFDIDWAHDNVLSDTIDIVEKADVAATWFVTHDTVILNRLRKNPKFELGIHPNFNLLLNGDSSNGKNAEEVLFRLKNIVPEAVSIRSHSMCQSSYLLNLFQKFGFTHDVNHYVPCDSGIQIKPWFLWNGMVRVPYNWEDDLYLMACNTEDNIQVAQSTCFSVFDFHPIHIFLNTENLCRYESTREWHYDEALLMHRFEGKGVRCLLNELLQLFKCDY